MVEATQLVSPGGGEFVECPRCAEFIRPAARICRFCGLQLVDAQPMGPPLTKTTGDVLPKSPVVALLLALLLPGLGHLYAGKIGAGIGWFVATLLAALGGSALVEVIARSRADWEAVQGPAVFVMLVVVTLVVAQVMDAYGAATKSRPSPEHGKSGAE